MDVAHSVKGLRRRRGATLVESVLVLPFALLMFLVCLQLFQLMEMAWLTEVAAENAARAAYVSDGTHPDPEVAAQLTLAPAAGTSFLRGVSEAPRRGVTGVASRYVAAILKTTASGTTEGTSATGSVTHAAELRIPLVNRWAVPVKSAWDWLLRGTDEKPMTLAEEWTLVSGRPHLQLEREVILDFGT